MADRRIIIAGGTGLIGSALCEFLVHQGWSVGVISRKAKADCPGMVFNYEDLPGCLENSYALINLAGENLANGRWSKARKQHFAASRVETTHQLVNALKQTVTPPRLLIQASAVGYYGSRADELLHEESAAGEGFLAELAREWEASAADSPVPTSIIRIGVVLSCRGGMLSKILPLFKYGLGGAWGPGNQYLSWIHLHDLCRACEFLLDNPHPNGIFNLTGPHPVTVKEFCQALSQTLHRPNFCRIPARLLKTAQGQMADELLLTSQKALPKRLQKSGFTFQYPTLSEAFANLLE